VDAFAPETKKEDKGYNSQIQDKKIQEKSFRTSHA
jgi:hypothetical protein